MSLVLLALGAIAVTAFGYRVNAQPGLLILLVCGAASFIPGIPHLELEPELILGVVVPPLLYAATLEFSFFSFMRNLRSILGLGVALVGLTALAAGYLIDWLLPAAGLATAFVLASIIAPPDTVTITGHGEKIGLPRRVTAILVGESLVNDAAALALFTLAVAAAAGTHTFLESPALLFGYAAVVGVVIGILLGVAATFIRARLGDPTLETALGLVLPFAAYLTAEHVHASGILAVVLAGFVVSVSSTFGSEGRANRRLSHRTRLKERELWPVVGSLLEALVFAYTGLQLKTVVDELPSGRTVLIGVILLVCVIVIRIAWVSFVFGRTIMKIRAFERRLNGNARFRARVEEHQRRHEARGRPRRELPKPLHWKESLLIAWSGMRGIVTLGAAGGIPLTTAAGAPFPHRNTLQFLAYFVVIGTLLLQGLTLPWLARRLRIDTSVEDAKAAEEIARAERLVAEVDGWDAKREAISQAVGHRQLDDAAALVVLDRLDRQQAAAD